MYQKMLWQCPVNVVKIDQILPWQLTSASIDLFHFGRKRV